MANKKTSSAPQNKGTSILLDAKASEKRVPLLESIYKNFARIAISELRSLMSGSSIEVVYEGMISDHFDTHFSPLLEKEAKMFSPFKVKEWSDGGLLLCNLSMLTASVKRMLGVVDLTTTQDKENKSSKTQVTKTEDALTAVEMHLGSKVFKVLLTSFEKAFHPIKPVTMLYEHMELRSKADFYLYPTLCSIGQFQLLIDGDPHAFHVVLPYTTIQPMKELLSHDYLGDKMGNDPLWKEHLDEELGEIDVTLKAVLAELSMPLRSLLKWRKGQVFLLYKTPESGIDVTCEDRKVFIGKMGRQKGSMAFSIEQSFLKHQRKNA